MAWLKKLHKHFSHETRKGLKHKFLTIFIILVLYFLFASLHFGLKDGFLVMLTTWSFFVLATPIPDGGIILDLPIRYFTNIKMIVSEIFVWILAITINVINFVFGTGVYDKTLLLTIFKDVITTPWPYGSIILLSCIGTFFSLYFGDELYDVLTHDKRKRYKKHHLTFKIVMMISIIVFIAIIYELLLHHLGVKFI